MIKHLILIPFLFALTSCKEIQTFEDKTCNTGKCGDNNNEKPGICRGHATFASFKNETFHTVLEDNSEFKFQAELSVQNNVATLTQYCKHGSDFADPSVNAGFSFDTFDKKIKFDANGPEIKKYGNRDCKAQISTERMKLSIEGSCMIWTGAKDTYYWIKGGI